MIREFALQKSIIFRQWQHSRQRAVHTQRMHAMYAVQESAEDLHADAPDEQCLMQLFIFQTIYNP